MRPCRKPLIQVVREGESACSFIMSERELFRCRGKSVPVLVNEVVPLLDGTRSIEQIGEAVASTLEPQAIRQLIDLLFANHVLFDAAAGDDLAPGDADRYAALLAFFSRFTDRPHAFLLSLRRARVVLVSDSPLLEETATALMSCGLGALDVVSAAESAPRIEAPAGTTLRAANLGDLRAICADADLVISLQDSEHRMLPRTRELNRVCIEARRRWLHVRMTLAAEAWIGPVYAPGSACFECFEARVQSHIKTWKENQLFEAEIAAGRLDAPRLALMPLTRQVAQMAAIEALHIASGFDPTRLVGRTRVVDLLTQESSLHTVLRLPRCPACSSLTVGRVFPWDEDTIQLDRMLLPREAAS